MPTAKEFAYEAEDIALTVTGYHEGKSGQNGLCDCIGLIMGAMNRLSRISYPIHDTNYFRRYQTNNLRTLKSGETLQVGQILYKARADQSDLDDRYKPGGRYHTPNDMQDYYHVGVITSLSPLEITHCTQDGSISGIKRDSSTKGWTHVGDVKGVDYATDTNVGRNEEATMSKTAYVSVPAGTSTANLRKRPDKSAPLIKRIMKGTVVDVLEQSDGWAKIVDPEGDKGYMMTEFLKALENADAESGEGDRKTAEDLHQSEETSADEVTLTLPKNAAEALYNAFMRAGGM